MTGYKYYYQILNHNDEFYHAMDKAERAREWCRRNFGEEYTDRWGMFIDGFNFNSEKDYVKFLMECA